MKKNIPIVSLFDKKFKLNIDNNIELNTNNIETYIEDVKTNFFFIKHDISNLEKFINNDNNSVNNIDDNIDYISGNHIFKSVNKSTNNTSEVQPNNGCIGLEYDIGIPPTNDIFKIYNFKFSNNTPFNFSASIPEFNIYDLPPNIKLLDFIPLFSDTPDYLDLDYAIIFPGVPASLPEIAYCEKKITKKIFGKRINLGVIPYPCGIKQKMIGSIYLKPDDSTSNIIYTFPKTGFKISGNIYINAKITAELSTNVPLSFLSETIKAFDKITYNIVTNNGINPFKNTNDAIRKVLSIVKEGLNWILKLVKYAYNFFKDGLTFSFTITSILIDYKIDITNIKAYHGDKNFEINNISYEENNYEILKNGKYIALEINSKSELSLVLDLGTRSLGNLEGQCNLTELLKKAINNGLSKIPISNNTADKLRKIELDLALNFLSIPNPINMFLMNNISIPINKSIKLCSSFSIPVPEVVACATVTFVLGDIIKFIKTDIINMVLRYLSISTYADAINVDSIENLIKEKIGVNVKIPEDIKRKINSINTKIDQVNNIYIGYIQLALNNAFSILDKIPVSEFPLTPSITYCVPIVPP